MGLAAAAVTVASPPPLAVLALPGCGRATRSNELSPVIAGLPGVVERPGKTRRCDKVSCCLDRAVPPDGPTQQSFAQAMAPAHSLIYPTERPSRRESQPSDAGPPDLS